MRKLLVLLVLTAAALALPGHARAIGQCGLPSSTPVWIDFGHPDVEEVFARPGVVVSGSTGEFPARLRAKGATTVYWDMNLRNRVGTPFQPTDAATIVDRANRLFDFAAAQSGCEKPVIVLNELFGASLETPWSATNTVYRANVLTLMRTLAERGARPMLLISSEPYTEGEARAWWVEAARYGDLVQEVYFNARTLYKQGTIVANRRLRIAFRRAVTNFTSIGIPVSKVGIVLGFQTGRGAGGREGLQPPHAWFETVKWQVLAARQVARELRFGSVISWGWGSYNGATADDKREAACVYLWTRNPALCNGPAMAGERFNASRADGQIRLSAGTQCTLGASRIASSQLGALQRVTADRDVAFSALLARIAESAYARVRTVEVLAAERRVVALRFRGSRGAYVSELRRAGANVTIARGILADELRRLQLEARLRGGRPSSAEVFAFYSGYPELLVRRIETKPAAPWLGRRRSGLALQALAPATVFGMPAGRWIRVAAPDRVYSVRAFGEAAPLASVPLPQARPTISAALANFSRRAAFEAWTHGRQEYVLQRAICRADDLPAPSGVRLTSYLPFLSLSGG